MKNLFFTIICLTGILGFSQSSPHRFSQNSTYKLIKKDGDTISFEIYSHDKKDLIYYTKKSQISKPRVLLYGIRLKKKVKNKNEKRIPIMGIEKLILNTTIGYAGNKDFSFFAPYSKFIKIKKRYTEVIVITEGYCDLYLDTSTEHYKFFVKRKGEEAAVEIQNQTGFGKKFKKAGAKYFEDCPEVLNLISKSDHKRSLSFLILKLEEIVKLYNKQCTKL